MLVILKNKFHTSVGTFPASIDGMPVTLPESLRGSLPKSAKIVNKVPEPQPSKPIMSHLLPGNQGRVRADNLADAQVLAQASVIIDAENDRAANLKRTAAALAAETKKAK